jgi:hypothetical protein
MGYLTCIEKEMTRITKLFKETPMKEASRIQKTITPYSQTDK